VKKVDKVDGPNTNKSEWIKLEFLMDPDNPVSDSKFSRQFAIFKYGCPEECIKWVKKLDKFDRTDADKSEWIKLDFLMDPDNSTWGSKYSLQFDIFKDGCPEEWIKLVMAFCEIENLMTMKEPADKTRMFRTLLKGQALSYFEHHLIRRLKAEDSEVSDNELIELVLRDVG
jgi:hypothetical protein